MALTLNPQSSLRQMWYDSEISGVMALDVRCRMGDRQCGHFSRIRCAPLDGVLLLKRAPDAFLEFDDQRVLQGVAQRLGEQSRFNGWQFRFPECSGSNPVHFAIDLLPNNFV